MTAAKIQMLDLQPDERKHSEQLGGLNSYLPRVFKQEMQSSQTRDSKQRSQYFGLFYRRYVLCYPWDICPYHYE